MLRVEEEEEHSSRWMEGKETYKEMKPNWIIALPGRYGLADAIRMPFIKKALSCLKLLALCASINFISEYRHSESVPIVGAEKRLE